MFNWFKRKMKAAFAKRKPAKAATSKPAPPTYREIKSAKARRAKARRM